MRFARFLQLMDGLAKYGNPVHVAFKRTFSKNGIMTIADRRTGVSVVATVKSSHMFGETWHTHDYDIPACPLRPGDTVIDIGANQGFFSCYAALRGAKVHAFEPFPDSFSRLKQNVARNGFSALVTTTQAAVSAAQGKARFFCSDYLGGGANTLVANHLESIRADATQTIEVDTISIDSILEETPEPIRLCKIDCEGAEYEILSHLSDPAKIDSFAIEFHPGAYRLHDLVDIVLRWGTHQVSFGSARNMLYAVRSPILLEFADTRR